MRQKSDAYGIHTTKTRAHGIHTTKYESRASHELHTELPNLTTLRIGVGLPEADTNKKRARVSNARDDLHETATELRNRDSSGSPPRPGDLGDERHILIQLVEDQIVESMVKFRPSSHHDVCAFEERMLGWTMLRGTRKEFRLNQDEQRKMWTRLYTRIANTDRYGSIMNVRTYNFKSARDARNKVLRILNELCEIKASVQDMWSWNPHPESTSGFKSDDKADPHELDKRHGQALMRELGSLAEVLKFRGGNWERETINWLDTNAFRLAILEMDAHTGIHKGYEPFTRT